MSASLSLVYKILAQSKTSSKIGAITSILRNIQNPIKIEHLRFSANLKTKLTEFYL